MNKFELIQTLKEKKGLSMVDAKKAVELFFDAMASALTQGQRVEIRGLCVFKVKQYSGYTGRNPLTGEKVAVKPKKLPYFKPGYELMKRVDR